MSMDREPEYMLERQQKNQQEEQRAMRGTIETVKLEQQNTPLPRWQQYLINGLAVVGALAILYVVATFIF